MSERELPTNSAERAKYLHDRHLIEWMGTIYTAELWAQLPKEVWMKAGVDAFLRKIAGSDV